jgi:hypothetical protein
VDIAADSAKQILCTQLPPVQNQEHGEITAAKQAKVRLRR